MPREKAIYKKICIFGEMQFKVCHLLNGLAAYRMFQMDCFLAKIFRIVPSVDALYESSKIFIAGIIIIALTAIFLGYNIMAANALAAF